jgi:alkyl hydroperoxide reductase subunit AhpC
MLTTAGRYREAAACYAAMEKLTSWSLAHLTICHTELGEFKQAQETLAKLKADWPGLSVDEIFENELNYFEDPAINTRYREILRQVGDER